MVLFKLTACLILSEGLFLSALGQNSCIPSMSLTPSSSHVCGSTVDVVSTVCCGDATDRPVVNGYGLSYTAANGAQCHNWQGSVGLSPGVNYLQGWSPMTDAYSGIVEVLSDPVVTTTVSNWDFRDPIPGNAATSAGPFLSNVGAYDRANWISARINATLTFDTSIGSGSIGFTFNAPGIGMSGATSTRNVAATSGTSSFLNEHSAADNPTPTSNLGPFQSPGGTWYKYSGWKQYFKYTWNVNSGACTASLSLEQPKL